MRACVLSVSACLYLTGTAWAEDSTGTLLYAGYDTLKTRQAKGINVDSTVTTPTTILTTGSLSVHAGDPWRFNGGTELQGIGGTWQLTAPLVVQGDVTLTTGSIAAGGRIAAGTGTHPTNGTSLQSPSLSIGAGVTNSSSYATAGHSYFSTASGAAENVLDVWTNTVFATYDLANASAAARIHRFRSASGTATEFRVTSNGTNLGSALTIRGTGTGTATITMYEPGSSGSAENNGDYFTFFRSTNQLDMIAREASGDIPVKFWNDNASFVANFSFDGRVGIGTTTPPTAGSQLQSPSAGIGAAVAGNASYATTGHHYVGTTSGATQNVLDISTDANNANYELANSGASGSVHKFRGVSGLLSQMLLAANGTNQAAHLLVRGTGTGVTNLALYEPGASGSSENTNDLVGITRESGVAQFIARDDDADVDVKFTNDNVTYAARYSFDGRVGLNTTTPPTSGAYLQTPSIDINSEEGTAVIADATSSITVSSSAITANDVVIVTYQDAPVGGGALWVHSLDPGVNFVIQATSAVTGDTQVNWKIIH